MRSLAPVLLAAASAAASPITSAVAAQGVCDFATQIRVIGTVASVSQAPAAPLAGVGVGDGFGLTLGFAGDISCTPSFGNEGYFAELLCCEMTLGGTTVAVDPMTANPCLWGEQFVLTPSNPVAAAVADVPFVAGNVRAILELNDPQHLVGVGLFDIINETIFVPSVTAPGFTARLALQDANGNELAVIDITEVSGTPGLSFSNYCIANPNSTGAPASMAYQGSPFVANNDLTLFALALPANSFCFFLVSETQGFIANPASSAGNLCIQGSIGRYVAPSQIQNSNSQQFVSLDIDLFNVPQPLGVQQTIPGMTWNFTAWFRDTAPGGTATSNFADGLSLTFL